MQDFCKSCKDSITICEKIIDMKAQDVKEHDLEDQDVGNEEIKEVNWKENDDAVYKHCIETLNLIGSLFEKKSETDHDNNDETKNSDPTSLFAELEQMMKCCNEDTKFIVQEIRSLDDTDQKEAIEICSKYFSLLKDTQATFTHCRNNIHGIKDCVHDMIKIMEKPKNAPKILIDDFKKNMWVKINTERFQLCLKNLSEYISKSTTENELTKLSSDWKTLRENSLNIAIKLDSSNIQEELPLLKRKSFWIKVAVTASIFAVLAGLTFGLGLVFLIPALGVADGITHVFLGVGGTVGLVSLGIRSWANKKKKEKHTILIREVSKLSLNLKNMSRQAIVMEKIVMCFQQNWNNLQYDFPKSACSKVFDLEEITKLVDRLKNVYSHVNQLDVDCVKLLDLCQKQILTFDKDIYSVLLNYEL